jgi:hypothetical protein
MMTREMPRTRRALLFRIFLGIVGIAAIVGFSTSLDVLLGTLGDPSFNPPGPVWRRRLKYTGMICAWCIMIWVAYQGVVRNLAPPEWLMFLLSVLIFATLFL